MAIYMAKCIAQDLVNSGIVEAEERTLFKIIAETILKNIEEERKIEEEAHRILREHIGEIEKEGLSYRKLFLRIKEKIAKERGIVL